MRSHNKMLGLLLCLLLAGCGFSRPVGNGILARLEGEAMLVPRGARPVVKIGLVAPFEGRYRSLGYEALYAVKLAVRERNDAGGVAGHMVELVALDDGDDPEASIVQATKFVVDEQVMGVVGPFSDATVWAAAPIYQEFSLAAVSPATCDSDIQSPSNARSTFCLGASEDMLSRALVERLPNNAQVTLLRVGAGALGDRVSPVASQILEAPWDATALAALQEHPPDAFLYDGDVLEAADFLVKARQAGIDAPLWGGPSLARTQLGQIAGEASAGTCYALTAPILGDLSPDGAFAVGYHELSGTAPGPWAALAYDAAYLLLDAVERAIQADGAPTREGAIAALTQAQGPDGQLVFDRGLRREADISFYCYEPGDAYPGTIRR